MIKLEIVGGGKMGTALAAGLLRSGWCGPLELRVVEAMPARREELATELPGVAIAELGGLCEAVLLAVKPAHVRAACESVGVSAGPGLARVLSVAAGVTTAQIESALARPDVAVVRVMPNTPSLVGEGASAVAPGAGADTSDLDWATGVLGAVGSVVRVTEAQLDAVTGLSGSGPAYVFLMAEAMIEAGVLNGLSRPISEQLVVQTLLGSAALLAAGDRDAGQLRGDVTSPGGTTAAGLFALEDRGVRAAFAAAVTAARARSQELGA